MTGLLLDRTMAQGLLRVAFAVLSEHFYYDYDSLEKFCTTFTSVINYEHLVLKESAPDDFKHEIWGSTVKKMEFTAVFVGFHLCKILYEQMNFTDEEVLAFETMLVKYIKVVDPHDTV